MGRSLADIDWKIVDKFLSSVQSEDKEMNWIDVQVQLPREGEEVWTCTLMPNFRGAYTPPYQQMVAVFRRSMGWTLPFSKTGLVHYWKPKPIDPELPKWYVVGQYDG